MNQGEHTFTYCGIWFIVPSSLLNISLNFKDCSLGFWSDALPVLISASEVFTPSSMVRYAIKKQVLRSFCPHVWRLQSALVSFLFAILYDMWSYCEEKLQNELINSPVHFRLYHLIYCAPTIIQHCINTNIFYPFLYGFA